MSAREAPDGAALAPEVHAALTTLDDRLVQVLWELDIKLLRSAWLRQQPDGYRLPRRQDIEVIERQLKVESASLTPFLSADEAVTLVRRGNRSVGVLSHGWLSPGDCDPGGARVAVVQRALRENTRIVGLFWECAMPRAHTLARWRMVV